METTDSTKVKREGLKKGIYILPSLFTTASLFCGFYSVIRSIMGDFPTAAWMILFAGVFDGLDGRVARLTKSQSEFGLQYDSLVDVGSFGMAPAVLAFTWSLHQFHRFGWAVAFLYFACGALRLARFNVQSNNIEKRYFQGLPIPASAYILATFVIFQFRMGIDASVSGYVLLPLMVVIALLMVSSVRYRSFKQIDFSKPKSFLFLVIAALVMGIIASMPQETMFLASLVFLISGPTEEVLHFVHRKKLLEKRFALRRTKQQDNVVPLSLGNRDKALKNGS